MEDPDTLLSIMAFLVEFHQGIGYIRNIVRNKLTPEEFEKAEEYFKMIDRGLGGLTDVLHKITLPHAWEKNMKK